MSETAAPAIAPSAPAPTNGAPASPAGTPKPTPNNFEAIVRARTAAAATPLPQPGQLGTPAAPAPANSNATSETAAAFNARIEQQLGAEAPKPSEPANDNAQTLEQQLAIESGAKPATDPLAELVHGLPAKDVLDAIKAGKLPEALATQLKGIARVNGQELEISAREAFNGYQRLTDYTRGTMEVAQMVEKLNAEKAGLLQFFTGWDTSDGIGQSLENMGLVPVARAALTKSWGTPEKPDPNGFMEDIRRHGHWNTFQQAATQYAEWWGQRYARYGGNPNDPARDAAAKRMIAEDESQQQQMWGARVQAETLAQQAQRQRWKEENQSKLAQQQTQQGQQQNSQQQFLQNVHALKTSAFGAVGLKASPENDQKFVENFMRVTQTAQFYGHQKSNEELVADAVRATLEEIAPLPTAAPATVAPSAPAPRLSTQPQGAPLTTASGVPRPGMGGPADLDARLAWIKGQKR